MSVPIRDKQRDTILEALDKGIQKYAAAGFYFDILKTDNEFKDMLGPLQDEMNLRLEAAKADDHIPEVERSIWTVKERCRGGIHHLPYACIP